MNQSIDTQLLHTEKKNLLKVLLKFKQSSKIYRTINIINLIFSFVTIGIVITLNYEPNYVKTHHNVFWLMFICQLYFLIHFIFDLLCMFIEKIFIIEDIILEVVSIFPFIVMRFICGFQFDLINQYDVLCTSLVCFRSTRMSKLERYFKSDANRQLYGIVCAFISRVLIFTVLINVIENSISVGKYWLFLPRDCTQCTHANETLHKSLFFVMTAIPTVGYYCPTVSFEGQVVVICLIIVTLVWINNACSILVDLLSISEYARISYTQRQGVEFVLITGNVSMENIKVLLQEYFHPDHGEHEKHALVLLPHKPENAMKKLIEQYRNKLFYIEGDCGKLNDLERCLFHKSQMIMLLCNQQSINPNEEDKHTIKKAMEIKKYLIREYDDEDEKEQTLPFPRFIVQLIQPENEHRFEVSVSKTSSKNQVICIEQLKLYLLAKSCLCQGIVPLLSNLITTNNMGNPPQKFLNVYPWINDYSSGKDYEIYMVSLDMYRGVSFDDLAMKIYNCGAILFGLNIESKETKNSIVILSPSGFVLSKADKNVEIFGYILAKDQNDATNVLNKLQSITRINKQHNHKRQDKNVLSSEMDLLYAPSQKMSDDYELEDTINYKMKFNSKTSIDYNSRIPFKSKYVLSQNYHISPEPIQMEHIVFQNLKDKMFIKEGHIILCGMCTNILDFIKPLRTKSLPKTECPTIVILTKEFPEKIWKTIEYFDEVFIVYGNPLNPKDLQRAGISTASKVVVLSPSLSSNRNTRTTNKILDAETVFKYNAVVKNRKDIYCIAELMDQKSVANINIGNRDEFAIINGGMDISFTLSFASGAIYYSNMMDNLATQSYYNPNLLGVVKKLIIGENDNIIKEKELQYYSTIKSGNLYLISMPNVDLFYIDNNNELSFETVFQQLLMKYKIIVIAVYKYYSSSERKEEDDSFNNGETIFSQPTSVDDNDGNDSYLKSNSLYYVVTSPDKQYKLTNKDKLFVLSQQYISVNEKGNIITKETFDELLKEDENYDINYAKYHLNKKNKTKDLKEFKKENDVEGEKKLKTLSETISILNSELHEIHDDIKEIIEMCPERISQCLKDKIGNIHKNGKLNSEM